MKMKIRSRITAILAAVLLVFAMMPMTASAEGAAEGHAGQSGWTEWTGTTSLPDRAGKYYLKGDVTLDSTWSVPNGETALCLNGKTIRLAEDRSGSVINIPSGSKLTVCDHSSDESGCITGGNTYQGGGVHNYGTFTLEGGSISGNKAIYNLNGYGGGVYNEENSTFTMKGGSISANTAAFSGGGVYNEENGTFTMEGGSISDNTSDYGGGVRNCGTFTMEGGSISGNTANESGGGVDNNGTFNMKGGSISGNTANESGGGVYAYRDGTINIGSGENGESRDIIISGNKARGKTSNVYLPDGVKINVTGNVSGASKIGVTTNDTPSSAQTPRAFTSGLSGKGSISNFFSDEGYAVTWTEGNSPEAQMTYHVHDWTIEKAESGKACDITCPKADCPYGRFTVTATADDRDYTGKPYAGAALGHELPPALSVTWTYTGRDGTAYGPSETAPTNAGAYTAEAKIMVEADPDTNGTISLPFTINKAPLTVTAIEQTYVYNGFEQGPSDAVYEDPAELASMVAASGLQGGDKLTQVVVDGQAGPKIGLYPTVLIPGAAEINGGKATENYEITYVNGPIRITPIPLKVTIRGSSATKEYNGKEQTYKGTVTVTSSDNAFDPSKFRYTGSTTVKGTGAGTYTTALATEKCIYSDPLYELNVTVGDPIRLTIKQAPKPTTKPAPKPTTKPTTKPAPKPTTKPTTRPAPKPDPKPDKVSGTLIVKMTAKGKRSLTLSWTGIKGADGYDIFFSRCNHGKKHPECRKVKTIKAGAAKSGVIRWTKKELNKRKAYKAYVKAWTMKDGRKTYIRTSPAVHAFTSGYTKKYTNPRSVKVKKANVLLTAGSASNSTYKIKASVKKLRSGKRLMSKKHAPKLRYLSSDERIATVSKSGKITARSKGKCTICIYAVNGVSKTVYVTVK